MSHLNSRRFLVLFLAVGLLIASGARGAGAKGAGTKGAGKKKGSPHAAQITALEQVHALLVQADHDYKGHRVKAMHHVHAAVHALKVGAKGPKNPLKVAKGSGTMAQAESDVLLHKAMNRIKTIQGQLSSGDGRGGAAATSLQAAVKELNMALKIK